MDKDDWRLRNQTDYLLKEKLFLMTWKQTLPHWDHDHCDFCFDTFSECPEDLHEGYATADQHRWICQKCFEDFKDDFMWEVEIKHI